ncbi:MAG: hypothetical protein Q8Q15_00010 [bacterium]|nr:hypothetical protein [bacterium]
MERLTDTGEKFGALKVRVGKPFFPFPRTLQPDKIHSKSEYGMCPVLVCRIEVEGVGNGEIRLVRDDDLEEMLTITSLRTPTGPIELRVRMENDVPEIVTESAPLCVDASFQLSEEEAQRVKIRLIFKDKIFDGSKDIDLADESGHFFTTFFTWIEALSPDGDHTLYFPADPQILSQIGFVVDRE